MAGNDSSSVSGSLEAQATALQSDGSTIVQSLEQQLSQLRDWHKSTACELEARREAVEAREAKAGEKEEANGRAEADLARQRQTLEQEQDELAELRRNVEHEKQRVERIRAELEEQRKELRDLRGELDEEWSSVRRMQRAHEQMTEALESERARVNQQRFRLGASEGEAKGEGDTLPLSEAA